MRRGIASGIAVAFGGAIVLLVAVFVGEEMVIPPLGPLLTGFGITLLSFLSPVAFALNWWVTLGALALAFRIRHVASTHRPHNQPL